MTADAVVGVIATALSCGVQPRQTWHVIKTQHVPADRATLTVPGMMILLSIGVLWTGYGWAIGAYASSLLAAVESVCQLIMLAVLARHGDIRRQDWVLLVLPAACVVAVVVGGGDQLGRCTRRGCFPWPCSQHRRISSSSTGTIPSLAMPGRQWL